MEEEADNAAAKTAADGGGEEARTTGPTPTEAQRAWLARGLEQPGGKLPLFDHEGQRVSIRTVESCIRHGWAEPWFNNPLKPDWMVCKLTAAGRRIAESDAAEATRQAAANIVPLRR